MPQRDGLDPICFRVPLSAGHAETEPGRDAPAGGAVTPGIPRPVALDALVARFPAMGDPAATPLRLRFERGEIVRADGTTWGAADPIRPGDELWFHRELHDEHVPEAQLPILHRDDHLLVVDKPHDMATMPRGAHVLSSALVRLRRATGITTLSPLHRLDRRTAGVLVLGVRPEERAAYQQLFARREVDKEYLARVRPTGESESLPDALGGRALLQDRLVKERGELCARVTPGEPNAITEVELRATEPDGTRVYALRPRTGRTHQLRLQLSARGMPILGEDLYPQPKEPEGPLHLLAASIAFPDPLTGQRRRFASQQQLPQLPRLP